MSLDTLQAVVLAAGLGLRMRPLTEATPKPLIPVNGKPLIDRVLDRLGASGIEMAVVNHHYLSDQVIAHLETRVHPAIRFSDERARLLETGGGVKHALPLLDDPAAPVLVCNSDTFWTDGGLAAVERLKRVWDPRRMDVLLLVHPRVEAVGYDGPGDFYPAPYGKLERRGMRKTAPLVFTGVQILDPALFADTPDGPFSLNLVYDRALQAGRLHGVVHDGDWFHVGTPDGLAQAEAALEARRAAVSGY